MCGWEGGAGERDGRAIPLPPGGRRAGGIPGGGPGGILRPGRGNRGAKIGGGPGGGGGTCNRVGAVGFG